MLKSEKFAQLDVLIGFKIWLSWTISRVVICKKANILSTAITTIESIVEDIIIAEGILGWI